MTAIKAGDVERAIRNRNPQVCVLLFYGPDAGRVAERARAVAEGEVSDPADPFQLIRLDGEGLLDQPGKLVDEATTYGLFGERRVILVRQTSRNITASVAACLDAAPDGTLIVIEAGDLSRSSPLRSLCEKSPRALALPCYSDDTRDLGTIITESLSNAGFTIDREARELMMDSLGGDRLASRGEITKLILYCQGRDRVTLDDVAAVVSDVSGLNLDAALDAAFNGDIATLEPNLRHLASNGVAPAQLLALGLRHALSLLAGRVAMDRGESADSVIRSWRGLHFSRKAAVTRQLGRWPATTLSRVTAALQEATLESRRNSALGQPIAAAAFFRIAARGSKAASA